MVGAAPEGTGWKKMGLIMHKAGNKEKEMKGWVGVEKKEGIGQPVTTIMKSFYSIRYRYDI